MRWRDVGYVWAGGLAGIAAWVLGGCLASSGGEPMEEPMVISPTAYVVWTNPPDTDLDHFEIGVWVPGGKKPDIHTLSDVGISTQANAPCRASLSPYLAGRDAGTYILAVRAVDHAGNRSDWSEHVPFRLDVDRPGAPTGIRLVVVPAQG